MVREIESVQNQVERSSDDITMVMLRLTLGIALIHHGANPGRGYEGLRALRETCVEERFALNMLPIFDTYLALERAQHGDVEFAIQQWGAIVEDMELGDKLSNIDLPLIFTAQQLLSLGDYDEAARVIERLMLVAVNYQWRSREISALQLEVQLAQARGEVTSLSGSARPLPCHGERARLRGPHQVGRGDGLGLEHRHRGAVSTQS